MNIQALRANLRQQRKQLSPQQRLDFGQQAAANALQLLADCQVKTVASFLSMAEEIDTTYLNQALFARDYDVYLPYVRKKNQPLEWVSYRPKSFLSHDLLGMVAPNINLEQTIAAQKLDAVLTPLVGFDKLGNRLGMGGGYYDRSFAFKSRGNQPYLLGFAYACQQVESLTTASWDIPLDGVITERHVVFFNINH